MGVAFNSSFVIVLFLEDWMICEDDLILEDEEKEEDGASKNGILIGILTKG